MPISKTKAVHHQPRFDKLRSEMWECKTPNKRLQGIHNILPHTLFQDATEGNYLIFNIYAYPIQRPFLSI